MLFTLSWTYITVIGTRYIPTWKLVEYIGIKTETRQRINAVDRSRSIFVSVYSIYIYFQSCLFVLKTGYV